MQNQVSRTNRLWRKSVFWIVPLGVSLVGISYAALRNGPKNELMELRVLGTTAEWFELVHRPIIAGRRLMPLDEERRSRVVVLTEHGARRLLATKNSIGQDLRIGGTFFKVIGIVKSEGVQEGGVETLDQTFDAYIPLAVARARFGDINTKRTAGSRIQEMVQLHQIIVQADTMEKVERTAAGIEHMLNFFHKKKDFKISVPLALLRQAEETKRTFNIVLGSIASISLLVGGIGIMNIMLAVVTERTREIGIRRAIGARRRQIVQQFLIETAVLSTTGGIVGTIVGMTIPRLITSLFRMPTIVTAESLLLSIGISVSIGIIFGLYPAIRAARLDPIVALRHE